MMAKNDDLKALFNRLEREMLSGLKHGFFEYEIHAEKKNGKTHVTLKAGKSYKYTITDDEIHTTSATEGIIERN